MVIFLFSAFAFVMAQNPLYFRVGDTIRGRDTIYHYQWWTEDWLSHPDYGLDYDPIFGCCDCISLCAHGLNGPLLRYCYTEEPLKVVGLAISSYLEQLFFFRHPQYTDPETAELDIPEYLLLYEADTGRNKLVRVDSLLYVNAQPKRYMETEVRSQYNYHTCCDENSPFLMLLPIREFYFEKPITVYDSFYVGTTRNGVNYSPYYDIQDLDFGLFVNVIGFEPRIGSETNPCANMCGPDCPPMPLQQYCYKAIHWIINTYDSVTGAEWILNSDTLWHYHAAPWFYMVFPIIEVDSNIYNLGPNYYHCPEVRDFRVGSINEEMVVLQWSADTRHSRWEVSYGPAGTPPGEGTVMSCAIQAMPLYNLDTCTHYTAYVRGICVPDSTVYGDWSEGIDIYLCDTTQPAGMYSLPDQLTALMPNPATSQVMVTSSYRINGVEVYDLSGKKMLSSYSADGHQAGPQDSTHSLVFNVEGWPDGMYIVVVNTVGGSVTKKLTVGL